MFSFLEESQTDHEPHVFIALIHEESSDEEHQAFVVVKKNRDPKTVKEDPKTVKEALASLNAHHWKEAMKKELENLKVKNTLELMLKPEDCPNVIRNYAPKWVRSYHF